MPNNIIQPLLTIAIPTWNRAKYLRLSLDQIAVQLSEVVHPIEILISDNCSDDETSDVADSFVRQGLPIRYIRNKENLGSDCNIAQCFNEARGQYVLILGDDDLLIDGALVKLLLTLEKGSYGVVFIRPYGYEIDFRREYPGGVARVRDFVDVNEFVVALGEFSTLISANVVSKEMLKGVDARDFCGTNLVQTYLVYRAALAAERNACMDQYLVACKRNNSGGYSFSQVFVDRFGAVLDYCRSLGLSDEAVVGIERRMLIGYYPYYVWSQRLAVGEELGLSQKRFSTRFAGRLSYQLFVAPIFYLPRPLALAWGVLAVALGRVLNGDARRGSRFIWHQIFKKRNP